ncbi:MAG: glucokinase [Candidatus Rokubacteria bacterium]|nr:glucokinase [Candidatus Rokubacteria bacterium]
MILAGDVGGTKTALALFEHRDGALVLVREAALPSREFPTLEAAVARFLADGARPPIEAACFGVAGPVVDGRLLIWDGRRHLVVASEGGHVDFAPRTDLEMDLLRFLRKEFGRVSYERVLSGPGLFNIYRFLRDTGDTHEPSWLGERIEHGDPSAVVSEVGLAGGHPLCVQALDLFASIYGAEAGNLALKALAVGGVFVGGGIAPKIRAKLADGTFATSFCDKGRFGGLMASIPVTLVLEPRAALLGAAHVAQGLLPVGR